MLISLAKTSVPKGKQIFGNLHEFTLYYKHTKGAKLGGRN